MDLLQHLISQIAGGSPEAWKLEKTWTPRTRRGAPMWDEGTKLIHQLARTGEEALAYIEEDVDGYLIVGASNGTAKVLAPGDHIVVQATQAVWQDAFPLPRSSEPDAYAQAMAAGQDASLANAGGL